MNQPQLVKKFCSWCGQVHVVRQADLNRGWGKCCSKSCAASLREKKTGNYQRYLASQERIHD